MLDATQWPLWLVLGVFLGATGAIVFAGTKLAGLADVLADRTGLGEALMGAVFLGATTSLPGIVVSVYAAMEGHPSLAFSNALGGIAVQTAFLAVADVSHPKVNLEHAAASIPNVLYALLLLVLLTLVLLVTHTPEISVLGVHPLSPLLIVAYLLGLVLVRRSSKVPPWLPRQTSGTVKDEPGEEGADTRSKSLRALVVSFALLALLTAVAGFLVGRTGVALADATGMRESVVGALLTAVSTSTPELVTAVAAVRRGALTLAAADIIGGNAFDVLFVAAADVAYRGGSIYHAIGGHELFLVALAALMTAVLSMGMIYRQEKGVGNIGFESVIVLVLYVGGMLVLGFT